MYLRLNVERQVGRYIKVKELCIDIRINKRQRIDRHRNGNADVPIAPIGTLPVLQRRGVFAHTAHTLDGIAFGQNGIIGLGHIRGTDYTLLRVVVEVAIRLLIGVVAGLIERDGVSAAHKAAIDYRQFPVTAVVDLSCAREDCA